jgi:uncharacterized membrane protein YccF (DUF307 family)
MLSRIEPGDPKVKEHMNLLLNIIWLVFGGFLIVIGYLLGSLLLCITIIGIPFGVQCFKLAGLAAAPFGREVREKEPPGGCVSIVMNIIWILLPGLELALAHLVLALFFGITIIGIPIAVQHLKMTRLALIPFGFEARGRY